MVLVICGWCRKEFDAIVTHSKHSGKGNSGRSILQCLNCGRVVNSSIKESTGNIVGRKHIHRELKYGDVV